MIGIYEFCYRWPLRTGAKVAVVTTFVYAGIFLVCGSIALYFSSEKLDADVNDQERKYTGDRLYVFYLMIMGGVVLIFTPIYLIGGLCLLLGLRKNKRELVRVWLDLIKICVAIILIPGFVILMIGNGIAHSQQFDEEEILENRRRLHPTTVKILLCGYVAFCSLFGMHVFMLYLWIMVHNFQKVLNAGGNGTEMIPMGRIRNPNLVSTPHQRSSYPSAPFTKSNIETVREM